MNAEKDWEKAVESGEFIVPEWVDLGYISTVETLSEIRDYGCESGVYMPAVRYRDALLTMSEYGDEIMEFLNDNYFFDSGIFNARHESFSSLCVQLLSAAVEIWAGSLYEELQDSMPQLF